MLHHNSSRMAKDVAVKLRLNQADELLLYKELSQIPDGPVKDAIAALVAKPAVRRYVAMIKGSCVRDAQYSKAYDADPADDDAWLDAEDTPLYLGIYEAETEIRARQMAASRERVSEDVISLIEI